MAFAPKSGRLRSADDYLPLDIVRNRLAAVWMIATFILYFTVVLQSLLGRYGDKTQEVWAWLLPTTMPTLSMVLSTLAYTALDPVRSALVARSTFFRIAFWLSTVYLCLVMLTIFIQPLVGSDPLELMRTSNLWLAPCQGLVASAMGVLFASKRHKK
jgi:hypothetical protein